MVVETKAGEMFKEPGLVSVSGSTLTLSRKNKIFPIELPQVQKAYRYVGRSRKKSTAIGLWPEELLVSVWDSASICQIRRMSLEQSCPALAIIGAGIGAVIGVATAEAVQRVLIYEPKSTANTTR